MIIMNLVCLKVLKLLALGQSFTVSRIAEKITAGASSVSRAVKELERRRFLERNGRLIMLARNPATQQLLAISSKFALEKILLDSREAVILALFEPKSINGLSASTGLSEVQVARLLKNLMETGAIFESAGLIFLNENVKELVAEMKKVSELENIEPYATVLFSNKSRLKKVLLGANAVGALSAFSRFAEHGVEYALINDFYIEPAHELSIEEIFVHALVATETKKDLAICLVFYEKNDDKLDFRKIVELSLEFKVLMLFFDCVAYLDRRTVKESDRFLPWSEFLAITEIYGVKNSVKQKFSAKDLEALLSEIGTVAEKPLEVFLIGGCNLALQGIKQSTKDIDLIVRNEKDFDALNAVLKKLGFKPLANIETAYKKMNPNAILVREGKPRVDIFTRIVCNALKLSDSMVDRSLERAYGKLSVKFLRPEDIILFKAITERDEDLEDIATIIRQQKPNWEYFIRELGKQHETSGTLFCIDVLDTIEVLEEKEKIKFGKKAELLNLCLEKSILFLARKPVSVAEIKAKMRFPETLIRNKIVNLVQKKMLEKTKDKPFKVMISGTKK